LEYMEHVTVRVLIPNWHPNRKKPRSQRTGGKF